MIRILDIMKEIDSNSLKRPRIAGSTLTFNIEAELKTLIDAKLTLKRPRIIFETSAFDKMRALVRECDKEIAWHGVVRQEDNVFIVEDILLYPQRITSTTVEAEEDKYSQWMVNLDDETHSKLRLQGHSHVNMGVIPSGIDEKYYDELMDHTEDYYIVMILNKKHEYMLRLYDIPNNVIFEKLLLEVEGHGEFAEWANTEITNYITTPAPAYMYNYLPKNQVYTGRPLTRRVEEEEEEDYFKDMFPNYEEEEPVEGKSIRNRMGYEIGLAYKDDFELMNSDPMISDNELVFSVDVLGESLEYKSFLAETKHLVDVLEKALTWTENGIKKSIRRTSAVKIAKELKTLMVKKAYADIITFKMDGKDIQIQLIGGYRV